MERLGVKANLPDILAALLPDQIAKAEERLELRLKLADRYREFFKKNGIRHPKINSGVVSAEHLMPIWVEAAVRDKFILSLNAMLKVTNSGLSLFIYE